MIEKIKYLTADKNPVVQECDATKAKYMYRPTAHKQATYKMKKILLILTLSCIAFIVHAQPKKIKGYLWATGGMNWATFFQSSNNVQTLKGVWGPEAALSLRVVYPTWLGYEAGVYYAAKGAKFSADTLGTVQLYYAGAFFNGLMYFPLLNNDDAYAGAGIYVAGAVNGKAGRGADKKDITFDGEEWNRYDMGLQLRGGYVIKNTIGFGLHYDIGLVPPFTGRDLADRTYHARNSVFNLFITLKLGKIFEKPFAR